MTNSDKRHSDSAEKTVRDIRRATRRKFSAKEGIRKPPCSGRGAGQKGPIQRHPNPICERNCGCSASAQACVSTNAGCDGSCRSGTTGARAG